MMTYDRRAVERRKLNENGNHTAFTYWIYALIAVAFLLSLVK